MSGPPRRQPGPTCAYCHKLVDESGWPDCCEESSIGESMRAYVSALWAEDWNSPEDAIYDNWK